MGNDARKTGGAGKLLFATAVSLLLLLAPAVQASEVVITPGSFHGEMIRKIIEVLRSLDMNGSANNIEYYLNKGLLIAKPLNGGDKGENDDLGGPVFIDSGAFPPPKKAWRTDKPFDLSQMLLLASVIVHEKFHSEVHYGFDRITANAWNKMGGGNPMEVQAWNVTLVFLDDTIANMLKKANALGISKEEKARWLQAAEYLMNDKKGLIVDYDNNKYGPPLWNVTAFEKLRQSVIGEREKAESELPKKPEDGEEVGLKSVIWDMEQFDRNANEMLAASREALDEEAKTASDKYAETVMAIAAASENRRFLTGPATVSLTLEIDQSPEFQTDRLEALLEYDGEKEAVFSRNKAGRAAYTVGFSEANFYRVYASDNPAQEARWLIRSGKIRASGPKPRPADTACGNGVLDSNEDCDYGHSCQAGLECSVYCACVIMTNDRTPLLQPLLPRDPLLPFLPGNDYSKAAEAFNGYAAGLPEHMRTALGDGRILLEVDDYGMTYAYSASFSGGRMTQFSKDSTGNGAKFTLKVKAGTKALEEIRDSLEPVAALAASLADGRIAVQASTSGDADRLALALAALNGLSPDSPASQMNLDRAKIIYQGKAGVLRAMPGGGKAVVEDGKAARVFDKAGRPIGFTRQRIVDLLAVNPAGFGASAGIYALPAERYADYWRQNHLSRPAPLPTRGSSYSVAGVLRNVHRAGNAYLEETGVIIHAG